VGVLGVPLPALVDGAIVGGALGRGVPLAGRLVPEPFEATVPPEKPELKTTAATPMTMSATAAQDRPMTTRRLGFTNSQLRLRRVRSSLPGEGGASRPGDGATTPAFDRLMAFPGIEATNASWRNG
jgi:hypothetical protein